MRIFLFLLVAINAVVWAMGSGWIGSNLPGTSRADRLMPAVAANAIHASTDLSDAPIAATINTNPPTTITAAALLCAESPPLDSEALKQLDAALSKLNPELRISRLAEVEGPQWAVVLGPFVDRPTAERKRDEVSTLGVRDFAVFENVRGRYVSLGVYSNRSNAQARLDEVGKKGVQAARVDNRALQGSRTVLQVQGSEPALKEKLQALGGLPSGTGWNNCPG